VTITSPPTATLASVLVRYIASVEGRNQKSVSGGNQEVEEYFTGGDAVCFARMCYSTPFHGSRCIAL
jgi:hypothetical protein